MLTGTLGSRRPRRRRGVALVEFAMVVPVVFVFMFGLIELSRYVMVQQALSSAAQRGCRKAMLATTINDGAVESAVRDYLGSALGSVADSDLVRIDVSPSGLNDIDSGTEITVQVQVSAADISWVRGSFFGGPGDLVLSGQSVLVRE